MLWPFSSLDLPCFLRIFSLEVLFVWSACCHLHFPSTSSASWSHFKCHLFVEAFPDLPKSGDLVTCPKALCIQPPYPSLKYPFNLFIWRSSLLGCKHRDSRVHSCLFTVDSSVPRMVLNREMQKEGKGTVSSPDPYHSTAL